MPTSHSASAASKPPHPKAHSHAKAKRNAPKVSPGHAGRKLAWVPLGLVSIWVLAALAFDLRPRGLMAVCVICYVGFLFSILRSSLHGWQKAAAWVAAHGLIIGWWLTLTPTGKGDWQTDVSRLPWSVQTGDRVVIHDVRNFFYQTETDYIPHWETRTVDLSKLQGADVFLTHWGVPLVAHCIISFRFSDGTYLATSIEARKVKGEDYSMIRGFFRQYEVIFLMADERDVVRLRTNFRQHEEVSLYRTKLTPADTRRLFENYLAWMNAARTQPQWYNAVTMNCGTEPIGFLADHKIGGISRWDWRGLLAGDGDKMLYDLGDLVTDGLPFDALKHQANINVVARAEDADPAFSSLIREGRAGFGPATAAKK
ncbi:MAG: DUF4105 domain-containing protein [Opitutaceae bacterium]